MQQIKSEVKLESDDKPQQRQVFAHMFANAPRLQLHQQVDNRALKYFS